MATTTAQSPAAAGGQPLRLAWIDQMKAIAILWIVLNHVVEPLFGYPQFANPKPDWPSLAERIAQLAPLPGDSLAGPFFDTLRYLGWTGDQGVQLFLILSGFGLTWGVTRRQSAAGTLGAFWKRRLMRIVPTWWGAHLVFLPLSALFGLGLALDDPRFWMSAAGIRCTIGTFYYFAPAWWFIGLLLQLYALFPPLQAVLARWGPPRFLLAVCAVCLPIRAAGLFYFADYLDPWSRGAIFVTRLPEFAAGMALAAWMARDPQRADAALRRPAAVLGAAATYAAGSALSFTLAGMAVAPFLLGVGAFVVLYALLGGLSPRLSGAPGALAAWLGANSFALYLSHHTPIRELVPFRPENVLSAMVLARVELALLAGAVLAAALTGATAAASRFVGRGRERHGGMGAFARAAAVVALVLAPLFLADGAVRTFDPQEVLGWGERPSLEPDDRFGWRVLPSATTRLRWLGYDYTVRSNSLGFPGPEPRPDEHVRLRVLVTGDAFSSAEGVDTDASWPRLLERELARRFPDETVEVLNFAVTGYGPRQYAAVVEEFTLRFRPDIIVVESFVNDFRDAVTTDEEFRASIGFGRPSQDGFRVRSRFAQLTKWVANRPLERLKTRLLDRRGDLGYFLGQFAYFEPDCPYLGAAERDAWEAQFRRIANTSRAAGAALLVLLVPAAPQVCDAAALPYWPATLAASAEPFDWDAPQRAAREILARLEVATIDLREILARPAGRCAYHAGNMHWTAEGHTLVAGAIARRLEAPAAVAPDGSAP